MNIIDLLGKKIILCDGGMGTMIQKHGLEAGELPETLNFSHPEIIQRIHEDYFDAGSNFVTTNTFGANAIKLAGSGYTVKQVVEQAVTLAKNAANKANKDQAFNFIFILNLGGYFDGPVFCFSTCPICNADEVRINILELIKSLKYGFHWRIQLWREHL